MNCKYVNCCRSEHLFPSAVSVASDDLVSTDENYNLTLVMAARNGVTDGVFIPGRRSCSYSVPEEALLLLLEGVRIRGITMEFTMEMNLIEL